MVAFWRFEGAQDAEVAVPCMDGPCAGSDWRFTFQEVFKNPQSDSVLGQETRLWAKSRQFYLPGLKSLKPVQREVSWLENFSTKEEDYTALLGY